jgi:phytoene dehydrogenase-like protein
MADCDILVVGAGHNALICAGYLARAGYRVLVLERRPVAGGAVVTEEIVPGFKFDLGGSAHILIHHTPVVRDLDLARYGLEYIDLDPLFYAPFPDGAAITIYKSVERTVENIARVSPADAEAYRAFIRRWLPLAEGMVETFNHAPTPLNLGRYLIARQGFGSAMFDRLTDILHGYGQVLREAFTGPHLPALIGWMAAQSGPPPTEPFSAPFALWHPMYHVSGMKRPRGGSGMLTQALVRMIEAHGGRVLTGTPVEQIVVEAGRAVGARAADGTVYTAARAVVSGAHIHTTIRLLGEAAPPALRSLVRRARTGNGFGMIVRLAVDQLPDYLTAPTGGEAGEHHRAMQFICPSLEYLERAYADYLAGRPSREPGVIAMTWSAADPTLAPPGKHVVFLWGQYYPFRLADGASWDEIGDREADRLLEVLRAYAPNMTAERVIGRLVETPLYLERELGLINGNVMHLEMSVDQMFMLRPALTLGRYRLPINGLYVTGASTHPGGGIMGAAGRNTAAAVLADLDRPAFLRRSRTR